MPKNKLSLFAIGLAISLSACGMKGGLTLPPGPPPEPLLGNPKPIPKEASKQKPAEDLSTSKDNAR